MKIIPITTWSPSRLKIAEQCMFHAQLKYGQKIPEPERELPPGKTEHANDRGTRIHLAAEQFIRGDIPAVISELASFKNELHSVRELYKQGRVRLEGEWGMDKGWNPVAWNAKDVWQRVKLDALIFLKAQIGLVVDYKTGKKFGNEITHHEQTQLYAVNTFLRHPELEVVYTELWYVDLDEMTSHTYERNKALRFKAGWHRRAEKLTEATEFRPNPSIFTCRYCPYGPGGTGDCERGVKI